MTQWLGSLNPRIPDSLLLPFSLSPIPMLSFTEFLNSKKFSSNSAHYWRKIANVDIRWNFKQQRTSSEHKNNGCRISLKRVPWTPGSLSVSVIFAWGWCRFECCCSNCGNMVFLSWVKTNVDVGYKVWMFWSYTSW